MSDQPRAGFGGSDTLVVNPENRVKQKSELLSDQHKRKSDIGKSPGQTARSPKSPNTRLVKSAMSTQEVRAVPCHAMAGPLRCAYCERTIRKGNAYIKWGDQPWHVRCYRITTDETYRPFDIGEGR